MNTSLDTLGTPMTQEEYAKGWKEDSKYMSIDGHYNWMMEQLGTQKLVIEIGCGAGVSTLALAKKSKVVCIESNANLVEISNSYLLSNNISSQIVECSELADSTAQVTIVNCDFFDKSLEKYLKSVEPTAIVCWLIGAAPETVAKNITTDKSIENFTVLEMRAYREKLHQRIYKLGVNLLKPQGMIHIVDRSMILSWNEKDASRMAVVEFHSELAGADYLIEKDNACLRRVPKKVARSSISMKSLYAPDKAINVLLSIKSFRR